MFLGRSLWAHQEPPGARVLPLSQPFLPLNSLSWHLRPRFSCQVSQTPSHTGPKLASHWNILSFFTPGGWSPPCAPGGHSPLASRLLHPNISLGAPQAHRSPLGSLSFLNLPLPPGSPLSSQSLGWTQGRLCHPQAFQGPALFLLISDSAPAFSPIP